MKPYIEKALDIQLDPKNYETFRAYMAEYHDLIEGIILESTSNDRTKTASVQNAIIKALPPKDRMVYNYMRLLTGIGWDGLMGALFNSDGKSVRDYREAIQLSGSEFLLEKFDKAIQLYRTKHGFLDPNSFSGILEMIKSALSMRTPAQDETAEEIDEIGEEIDNWEGEEMKASFYRLANS